jgi:hypothetical protein
MSWKVINMVKVGEKTIQNTKRVINPKSLIVVQCWVDARLGTE